MARIRVSSHVFVPEANQRITKTDVLTAIYITGDVILVRYQSHAKDMQSSFRSTTYIWHIVL
jgi:hypothetical protein